MISTIAGDQSVATVVVTRSSQAALDGGSCYYYTAGYTAADGALLLGKRYNGPADGDEYTTVRRSLALGWNGMVAITGSLIGTFGSDDFATVVYSENLPRVSVALVPAGVCLRFAGVPGTNYNIERALAITGTWSTIATPTAPLDGLIDYTDLNPPTGGACYRTNAQ